MPHKRKPHVKAAPKDIASATAPDGLLPARQVREVLSDWAARQRLQGQRVLAIIPDGTRTAPVAMLLGVLDELLAGRVGKLDCLVALGTHQPMDDAALSRLVGRPVKAGRAGAMSVLNHRWDSPDTFADLGTISAAETAALSDGRLSLDVPVRVNRLALEYDHLVICGPVFPHEVVGFSGGAKYFFPGISGPEMINATHWLGALLTNLAINGVIDTPVRRMLDLAAGMIPTPHSCIAMVMRGKELMGLHAGELGGAWRAAAEQSAGVNIIRIERPMRRILSIVPEMYDDLWTAAKGMYKVEPVLADGGEVVIYAPHIQQVSRTHGRDIERIGYHVRDYFLAQWERFKAEPWAVLAHSTHLRGAGTYIGGIERSRVNVTLATGIGRDVCERIGLGYADAGSIDQREWTDRERDGVMLIRRAGEMLYRLAGSK